MGKMNVRTKMRNIEFIRIFFAISIVYFHLLHSFMIPFTDETDAYQELALQSRYAKYIVECFFIMSGYFLYRSILADPGQKTLDFVMKKWIRLWPVLAVSTILSVVFLDVSLQEGFLNLFFSAVYRTDYRLDRTELVYICLFLCGDFLFYDVQGYEKFSRNEVSDLPDRVLWLYAESCVYRGRICTESDLWCVQSCYGKGCGRCRIGIPSWKFL